jgi:post-segregation antitoxin (ccd killing protein)
MANLTITVDPETLRRARIRALERGESVNSYLAEALRRYAGPDLDRQAEALSRLDAIADKAGVGSPDGGHAWTRDELHRG